MSTIEKLTDELWRQRFFDDQIIAYKVWTAHRVNIDAWIEACAADMFNAVRDNKNILVLQDLTSPRFGQTPYYRERGGELTDAFPELQGRVALLMAPGPEATRIRLFLRSGVNRKTRQRDAFVTWKEAMRWLMDAIDTDADVPPHIW